jgi:hypothetical protein
VGPARREYFELSGFQDIYLEDSYVLDITEFDHGIEFTVEVVLTEQHEMYRKPNKGIQYCYCEGIMRFPRARSIHWIEKTMRKIIDISGEIDYGNIHVFYEEEGRYFLAGEWGVIWIGSDPPTLIFK